MSRLRITVDGTTRLYEPIGARIVVGRSTDADIVVAGDSVSRTHLDVSYDGEHWLVSDTSSQGTFLKDGSPVDQTVVSREIEMSLGSSDGPRIVFAPDDETPDQHQPTMALDDRRLLVEIEGRTMQFVPGQSITIGRDAACDIALDESHPLVSRHHAEIAWGDAGWTLTDLGSTRGTFVDERRVRRSTRVEGALDVVLGAPRGGTVLRVVTAGTHRPRRSPAVIAVALVAILLITVVLLRGPLATQTSTANTTEQLAVARQATVLVELLDEDKNRVGPRGSGVLVDDSGLILTNAHVAFPTTHAERTDRQTEVVDPPFFAIGFATDDGGPVDRFFVAVAVEIHPWHDAALLQIIEDGNGQPVAGVPFRTLRLGTASDLKAGDPVDQLGFPDVAATLRVSVTTRNIQSVAPCTLEPEDDCKQELPDGWLNISGDALGPGSSGGPLVRRGVIVGLNHGSVFLLSDGTGQNRAVPIDAVIEGFASLDS